MKTSALHRGYLLASAMVLLVITPPAWSQDAPAHVLRPVQPSPTATEPDPQPAEHASEVEAAIAQYQNALRQARAAGRTMAREDIGELIDQAFADLDFKAIPTDQIEKAISGVPMVFSDRTVRRVDEALEHYMKQETPEGARAASLRLLLHPRHVDEASHLAILEASLKHPALRQAIALGTVSPLLSASAALPEERFKPLVDLLNHAATRLPEDASVDDFRRASGFFLSAGRNQSTRMMKAIDPYRRALISAIDARMEQDLSERDQSLLQSARHRLAGALARGELIDHPAPEMNFLWYFDPQNEEARFTSLKDLRGKVVVLDFWATWCGPCIASFPNVRELRQYYEGFDVVVLGVTSIQGRHIGMRQRVNTQGNPEQEMELMKSFIEERQMTWPVAFSEQNVFNPDYGITGIPSVAIIDPAGKVRHIGLHPGRPLTEKVRLINPLLSEAGKPVPALATATPSSDDE
ncbi:MAG: TlpA family protein disulfide reductase [Phycisphaeraceae bacterium]|nr:TlpA family protein disulfide reductase [Phycisphaeraceae bacterium]